MSSEYPHIIFFFGAGASKPADVGTTIEMVSDFGKFLQNPSKANEKKLFDEIVTALNKNDLDIEDLMTSIDRLIERDDDIILKFYRNQELKLEHANLLHNLRNSLKHFIQVTTAVEDNKTNFLKPILVFNRTNNPIKIFSVNYDTLVEQFCNVFNLRYTDGFEYSWHPELFENNEFVIHLYKLHGSIMWYKTDRNNYIKLPITPPKKPVDLIFKEKAIPLMLYPMQKWEFVEPLLTMLLMFKNELEKARFLILVGYSFRDSHILRLFHESARNNDELIVIFVSPHARQIYENELRVYKLEEFEAGKITTSLENRVLCLQYGFSEMIDKLESIVGKCNGAINSQKEYEARKLRGSKNDPKDLIIQFSDIEFLDRANSLRDDLKWNWHFTLKTFDTELMVACFKLFTVAEIQNEIDSSKYWLSKFLFPFLLITKKMPSKFKVVPNGIMFDSLDAAIDFSGSEHQLKGLISFIQKQKELRKDLLSNFLEDIMNKIEQWFYHVYDIYKGENILFDDYFQKIRNFCVGSGLETPQSIFGFLEQVESGKIKDDDKAYDAVKKTVMAVEDSIHTQVFGQSGSLLGYVKEAYPSKLVKG